MTNPNAPTEQDRADLRERNLAAFHKYSSQMAGMLENHKPATKLIFDEDGQPDILFEGQKFYDGRHDEIVAEQLKAFEENPSRFNLAVPQPGESDKYGTEFTNNLLRRLAVDGDMEFLVRRRDLKSFFAIVFGIGLGGHIDGIVEISDCRSLIFIDPNIETMYHSLEVYDWAALFESQVEKRALIEFVITNDANSAFEAIKYRIRSVSSPSIDGTHLCVHYNNAMFQEVQQLIQKNGNLLLAGLGFFDDERVMISNTHKNISMGGAHIYQQVSGKPVRVPCFIVGCGPSLDQDLAVIKKHADNVIVISSGSALGPLLNAGITPDFQMEVENVGILPIMEHVAEEHDISEICLVTSTTVEPEIVKYFNRIIYHFRPALSPYGIFSDNPKNTIPFHDPSVVNSSLGFAQDLGFRQFYFFGCDMGTRDADMHHAKNSYHFTEGAQLPDNDFCIPVPANFGGETKTSRGLFWVKSSVENAISHNRAGRSYYNCTDGAFIEGTIAKFAKKVSIDEIDDQNFKHDFVAKTVENCSVMPDEVFNALWNDEHIQEIIDDCIDRLKAIFETAKFVTDKDFQIDINNVVFHSDTSTKRGIATMFRGTIHMALLSAEFYAGRINHDEDIEEFEAACREELIDLCDILHKEATELVEDLSKEKALH